MRLACAAVLTAALVAGCGGSGPATSDAGKQRTTKPATADPPAPLVELNRVTGVDPQADTITVQRDGRVLVRRLRGGAGGRLDRFALRPAELTTLRAALAPLGRARFPQPAQDLDRYLYTLRVGTRPPLGFVERRIPPAARRATALLERLIDTSGARG